MIFAIYSLYQFSKQTIDWTKELSRCKAIMWGAFQNLGSALDTWADLEEFDDLLQKTARMFVCVPPKKLRELQLVDILFLLIIRVMHHYCESGPSFLKSSYGFGKCSLMDFCTRAATFYRPDDVFTASGTKQPILNGTKQPIFKIGQKSRFSK